MPILYKYICTVLLRFIWNIFDVRYLSVLVSLIYSYISKGACLYGPEEATFLSRNAPTDPCHIYFNISQWPNWDFAVGVEIVILSLIIM